MSLRAVLARRASLFVFVLLAIELLDEFIYGAREAAWPLIRDDLNLNYAQIGLLLAVPALFASFIEPFLGILADTGKRRVLILGGGLLFALSCLLSAISRDFTLLLLSFMLFYPASGAFVSLSQATLMDIDPARHEHNMARWTLAGSLGVVAGALGLGALVLLGFGWREVFLLAALWALGLFFLVRRMTFPQPQTEDGAEIGFMQAVRSAGRALRRREVWRWLLLLEFSDFLLDILHGYLALYFVDVVRVSESEAGIAIAAWTGIGLMGDVLLIPLLERVRGLTYLRYSVLASLILYPLFLLVPGFWPKVVILALLGFGNAGWYSILQGQVYSAMPGQSGTVLALNNLVGFIHPLLPAIIGFAAERFGLDAALWLLWSAPIVLLLGIPRRTAPTEPAPDVVSS
ncbi:MAG: MFS transporter [Chloroflexi bacterium]|nr:MFS transporter [Chloroflexota bacterium]